MSAGASSEGGLLRLGLKPPRLLITIDEVGYIPLDPEVTVFFALVSSCNERSSIIVGSNKTFSAWAEIFGDPWRSPPSATPRAPFRGARLGRRSLPAQGQKQGGALRR